MRSIKMLGIAAMATMVAMAFVGTSSAMAEPEHPEIVLCEGAELICELENWAGFSLLTLKHEPVEIHLETLPQEPPKLLTSIGNIECEHSLVILTLLNKLAKLIEGHLLASNLTGNCHLGSTKCTVTVNELGGLSFTPDEEKLKAIVKAIPLEGKETTTSIKCGFLINCTFSAEENTKLLAHSDEKGHLLLLGNKTPLKRTGGFCPEVTELDVTFHAVNLDSELSLKLGLWIEL
jgi:hypothetical protein